MTSGEIPTSEELVLNSSSQHEVLVSVDRRFSHHSGRLNYTSAGFYLQFLAFDIQGSFS